MYELLKTLVRDKRFYVALIMISLLASMSYLSGYWCMFGLNSMISYGTILDLIRFAATPLLSVSLAFLFTFYVVSVFPRLTQYLIDKADVNSKRYLIIMLVKLVVILVLALCHASFLYLAIPVLIIMGGSYQLSKHELIDKYHVIGVLLVVTLLASYLCGIQHANKIKKNKRYIYTNIELDNTKEKFKLIGNMNNHYYFTDESNKRIVITKDVDLLTLEKYP